MDLKRLGVSIDPRQAIAGAKQVKAAVGGIGTTVKRELDKVDRSVARMGKNVKDSAGKMRDGMGQFVKGSKKASGSAKVLGGDMAYLQAQSVLAAGGLGRAAGAMGAFGAAAGGAMAALAPLLAVLLPIIIAVKAFQAVLGAAVAGTKLAGEIQRLEISFTALTGSASEAKHILSELRKTALQTGVAVGDQATTVQKFIALGFDSTNAIKLQRNILDVAGAVGLTATEAKLLGSALAQVQSKGVVSMEELRQQIAEKGIPAIDELMKKTGMFGKEFFDSIAKGEVASKELIDIFLNLEGSFAKFEGGAKRIAKSIPGQVAIIGTSWQELLREMGTPIADAVGPIMQDLINILQAGSGFGRSFGEGIGNAIRILYGAVSDGKLGELIGTTFMSGVEIGLNFLANGFIQAVMDFSNLLGSSLEFAGKTVTNVLGGAFEAVTNAFISGIEKAIQAISNILAQVAETANAVPGVSGVAAPTPFALGSLPRVDIAKDERSFGDIAAENGKSTDFAADKLKDPFGTVFQDAAANQTAALLTKSFEKSGKGAFTFAGDAEEPPIPKELLDPVTDTGGGGKAAKTKEENEALEVQLSVLGELQQRLGNLTTEWLNVGAAISDIAEGAVNSFAENLSSALFNVASGAQSAGDAFRDMANAIVQSIVQMVIQMTVQLAVAQALQALGVPVAAVGTVATAAKAVAVNHSGGVGGEVKTGRGFSKFHEGGTLSSENLNLTDKNETVLTRRRAEELERELRSSRTPNSTEGGQSRPLQIVNLLDQKEVLEMVAANPDVTVNAISRRRKQVDGVLKGR